MNVAKSVEPLMYLTVVTNCLDDFWLGSLSFLHCHLAVACNLAVACTPPALRDVKDCAHCGSVKLRLFTRIVVSRLSRFLKLGTRRWTAIFPSITLRTPTCPNELPTLIVGENVSTIFGFEMCEHLLHVFCWSLSCSRRLHAGLKQSGTRSNQEL